MIDHDPTNPHRTEMPEVPFDDSKLLIFGEHGETAGITSYGPISCMAVSRAIGFVDGSGIVERMEHLHATFMTALRGKRAGVGRKPEMTFREVMIIMFIAIFDGRPPLGTSLEEVVRRITDEDLQRIGLDPDRTRADGLYYRIMGTIARFLKCVDPYPSLRHKRMKQDEHMELRGLEAEDPNVPVMINRLDWFAEGLLEATWRTLPEVVRRRWHGNLAGDGTLINGPKRGNGPSHEFASIDRDTGWWGRGGDHSVADNEASQESHVNGYEATLTVTVPNFPHNAGEPAEFPVMSLGMAFGRPGVGATILAGRATASVYRRGHPAGLWLGDGLLFPHARVENLQQPVRAMGYQFASDLHPDYLGRKVSHQGAHMVEGTWYCPAMPQTLQDASKKYHQELEAAKKIRKKPERKSAKNRAFEKWQKLIASRTKYALKLREATIAPGGKIPYACPHGITVNCALKARLIEERAEATGRPSKPRPTRKPNGDPLFPIPLKHTPSRPPAICCNIKSTHFDPAAGIKHEQAFEYGSWEQQAAYDLRTVVEGFNGYIKRTTQEGAAAVDRRLIRGFAGQYFLLSILVAASNLRKAQSFLKKYGDQPTPKVKGKNVGTQVAAALPKQQFRATRLGAYVHFLPEEPVLDLDPSEMDRHRALADHKGRRKKPVNITPIDGVGDEGAALAA